MGYTHQMAIPIGKIMTTVTLRVLRYTILSDKPVSKSSSWDLLQVAHHFVAMHHICFNLAMATSLLQGPSVSLDPSIFQERWINLKFEKWLGLVGHEVGETLS